MIKFQYFIDKNEEIILKETQNEDKITYNY